MTILVIGYGNPLREDDGAGWYVADRVAEQVGDLARILTLHQLTPDLAADLAGVDRVVFVDARVTEPERGVVVERIEGSDAPMRTHYFSPSTLLATTSILFGRSPQAWLVSVPAVSLRFSESLTALTRTAADTAVTEVVRLVLAPTWMVESSPDDTRADF